MKENNVGFFAGYASTFHEVDLQLDQIAPGAFKKSLQRAYRANQLPPMLWQHDPQYPIGTWELIKEDHKGLFVKGRLILNTQKGQEAWNLLKERAVCRLSIGFQVVQALKDSKTKVRTLTEINLLEISLVTFAASPSALIFSLSS